MEKETNKFHALQLFTDTIAAETVHLTNEQVGIYNRLIWFSWTKNTKPFTTESARRICQCRNAECDSKVDKILREFFIFNKKELNWTHKRLVKEHKYLTDKYKARSEAGRKGGLAKSDNASSKMIPPIPTPIPIPNKQLKIAFDEFWSLLTYKKGSKYLAGKRYAQQCPDLKPKQVADAFNRYASKVKDKEFLAHVSTWINQRRFEDDENNKPKEIKEPTYEFKGIKLKTIGEFGEFIELKDDKGNKYQKHKFRNIPIEKV